MMIVTTLHKLHISFSHLELILRSQGCQKGKLLVVISSNEKGLDIYEKSLDLIYIYIYEKVWIYMRRVWIYMRRVWIYMRGVWICMRRVWKCTFTYERV